MSTTAKIQMYRLNELGDCFLVTFTTGNQSSRLLIDCGSFRNDGKAVNRINEIVDAIGIAVGGKPLDVVVGTHQHNDHVSGFVHAQAKFKAIGVDQVWLSWLDDPIDQVALDIGEHHHNLKVHLTAVRDSFARPGAGGGKKGAVAARSLEVLNDILGFYGASAAAAVPELPAEGIKILKAIGKKKPLYLRPGRILAMPGLPAGSVKIHVLGPPRDHDLLYDIKPKKGESYDHALAAASLRAAKFRSAVTGSPGDGSDEEANYPFANRYKQFSPGRGSPALRALVRAYRGADEAWRTIDEDWLASAEALALYLDSFTNNSSLVLAIELVESGKVLLFAADAQTGNWLSWDSVVWEDLHVKTDDLLARTVFYKVGHHASHNATLVAAFEKMQDPNLVALIPVHKKDPNITKENGWKMPATKLFKRLKQKTSNRVLQMDDVNPAACNPSKEPAKTAWAKTGIKPKVTAACVELEIS